MTDKTNESYQLPPGKKDELIEFAITSLYEADPDDLRNVCISLGLLAANAPANERLDIRSRLNELSDEQIMTVARAIDEKYPRFELTELIRKLKEFNTGPEVSEITRRALIDALNSVELFGELHPVEELNKIWPLASMPGPWKSKSMEESIYQHFVRNPDWQNNELLEKLGIFTCSRTLLFKLIEAVVHPRARHSERQTKLITQLEPHLKNDGYHFLQTSTISGYPVFSVVSTRGRVSGTPKNLIFAADGYKPEIVLSDAINNDIKIVKNEEYCLIYERPIGNNGLTKKDMLDWWAAREGIKDENAARRSLYERLKRSLDSDGEHNLFEFYYKATKTFGDGVPALIPQVYLHYDPYTIKQLGGLSRLPRQRMDFLILFSSAVRVVLEVDGSQHFATDGRASLPKYAAMMAADRELKLAGYEVFRFGANELVGNDAEKLITSFVQALLKKHGFS